MFASRCVDDGMGRGSFSHTLCKKKTPNNVISILQLAEDHIASRHLSPAMVDNVPEIGMEQQNNAIIVLNYLCNVLSCNSTGANGPQVYGPFQWLIDSKIMAKHYFAASEIANAIADNDLIPMEDEVFPRM